MTLDIVGVSPIGRNQADKLEPHYSIDGKFVGQGPTGYESILVALQTLPVGSKVTLRREVALILEGHNDGKYTGVTSVGAHPFLFPLEAFNKLKRIAAERHLSLRFVPSLESD